MRYKVFLFLRWVGRLVYRSCSWLSNKVYQVPAVKKVVNEENYKPTDYYEFKRQFSWLLEIDGIPSFAVKAATRPNVTTGNDNRSLWAVFYDPVSPSTASALWRWWKSGEKRNAKLVFLDSRGITIEKWHYVGVIPYNVDFGFLDYSNANPVEITLSANCDSVELVDEKERVGASRE